jgi:hypothetical protein
MKYLLLSILIAAAGVLSFSFRERGGSNLKIVFHNKVGDTDLVLGYTYVNPFDEEITITNFKYYLSNFQFHPKGPGKSFKIRNSYHFLNQGEESSLILNFNLPHGSFASFCFLIGVDSTRNVSGIQSGALDPMNGMFWTWNTGYINAKLEGFSPASKVAPQKVEYHVGGFRQKENTVRKIILPFSAENIVSNGNEMELHINVDINKWFKSTHEIKIADTAVMMTPGKLAVKFADNYANMFSIAPKQ